MKPQTKIAIAQLLAAAGSALTAFAAEILDSDTACPAGTGWRDQNGPCDAPEATTQAPAETEKPKRGRKASAPEPAPAPAPETESTPAPEPELTPVQEQAPEPTPAPVEAGEESDEAKQARYKENQGRIEKLVKVQMKGADVKKIIAKYSTGGMIDIPLKHQKAFETDLEALSM